MSVRSRLLPALVAVAAAAAVASCGSDDGDAGATTAPSSPAGNADTAGAEVELAASPLGDILVDDEGRTLYLFTNDTQGSGESTCEGDCLANWPALEGEVEAGEGVDAGLLGTIERSDGTIQATYNDWPLYFFAADAAPGDVNGQGVNDVWFVVDAEGKAVKEAADSGDSGSDESSGYSY